MICFTRLVFKRVEPLVYAFYIVMVHRPKVFVELSQTSFSSSPGRRDKVNVEPCV